MDYRIGMVLTGKVIGVQNYGVFVLLDDNTQGLVHISELTHGYVNNINNYFKIGQMVKVMIIDIDEYNGKISLSLKCLEKPFNFNYNRDEITHHYKKYWNDQHANEGFTPIENKIHQWITDALEDIENGK